MVFGRVNDRHKKKRHGSVLQGGKSHDPCLRGACIQISFAVIQEKQRGVKSGCSSFCRMADYFLKEVFRKSIYLRRIYTSCTLCPLLLSVALVHKAVFTIGKERRNIRNQFFRLSRSLIAMGLLGLQRKLFILGDQEVYFAECGGKLGDCSSMTEMTSCAPCRMPIGWRRNGIKKRTRRRNTGRMVRHDERFTIYHL